MLHTQSWTISEEEAKRLRTVEAPGHRSGIRALALSSDDAVLLSAAAGAVKLWNPTSGVCLRTIETGQVLLSLRLVQLIIAKHLHGMIAGERR